jgi:TP901 family phage tail tape measure protein
MNRAGNAQMAATGKQFKSLYHNAKLAQTGVREIGTGMRQLAMFGMGAIAVLGGVVKRGMEFGKAWTDARAVLRGAPKDIQALRYQSKQLGATTLFTAAQAAKGMEELARAGLDAKRVSQAIRPVIKLSIADNVDVAAASKLAARAVNVFKDQMLTFTQVADHFAYVSRNSATNTTELSEAFKFAAPAARLAKQDFSELMGTLGLLAQAGYVGSLAGTAYKNAVVKLAKGGEAANKVFGGRQAFLNAVTDKKTGKWKSFADILRLTMTRLGKIKNEAVRAGLAFKLFGIRGIATFGAFEAGQGEDFANLITNIKKGSIGTAEAMAKIKQQSLHGQWLLFKSALDGVALSLYDIIQPTVVASVKMFSTALSDVAAAFKMMSEGATESEVAIKKGKLIAAVAFGIKEAFVEVGQTLKKTGLTIYGVLAKISGKSKLSAKDITKLVTKFILFAAAITPIIAGVGALALAFSGMFQVVSGGIKIISALTSRWGLAFLAITYAFAGGKKKGESYFVTMTRGLKRMISFANKLLWPFKQLAKYLGTIPALMAGIMTYKVGKGLLARAGGALSMSRNPLARALGGVTGAATGMPVFVTNWPPGAALGGGAGGLGAGPAAAAGKAGFFSRLGRFGKTVGMGAAGLFTGGKVVSTSVGATAGAAKFAGALGTAGMAVGAFTAAIAPAAAGLYAMGRAYDPKFQAEHRRKIMKMAKEDQANTLYEIIQSTAKKQGVKFRAEKFRSLEEIRAETWEQKRARETREKYGIEAGETELLKKSYKQIRAGQYWEAAGGTAEFGTERMAGLYAKTSDYELSQLGLTREMVTQLRAIALAGTQQLNFLAQGFVTKVVIDGKEVAIATATHRNESRERAGKIPTAGSRRRALTRGTD